MREKVFVGDVVLLWFMVLLGLIVFAQAFGWF